MDKKLVTKRAATDELWRRGSLSLFKLVPEQKEMAKLIEESDQKIVVVLCSRRLGKTFFAICLAVQTCLKTEGAVVKFVAPTNKSLKDNIEPLMTKILEDCPDELRPEYVKSRNMFRFKNSSVLHMAGTDSGNAERLRGGFAHLCIIDESQSCNDLTNTVRSILIPTTTHTKGKVVLLGTPPNDPEHDFMKFVAEAEEKDVLIKRTIYDSTIITKDELEGILAAYPGRENHPDFKREYLCIVQKNLEYSAVPEFTDELEKDVVKEWTRPPHFDYYEAMDLGGKDLTVVLFAYFDFRNAVIVIEDELVMNFQEKDNNIASLVRRIKEKEAEHFSDPLVHEIKKPFYRTSDIDYIALGEIRKHSNNTIDFRPTKKDEKAAAVNNLRIMIANKRIMINPRCKTLVKHLRNVKWSKSNRNVFDRSVDMGHYDAVDALIYLTRAIVYGKNPYPANFGLNQTDLVFLGNSNQPRESAVDVFRNIFKVGKKYGR
jgi:hypothetical protein